MKFFTTIFFLFLSSQAFSQIVIRGAKDTKIIETNKEKAEVKEINDINFTKATEENVYPSYVKTNTISNSKVENTEESINVNISGNNTVPGEKKEIVINLDEAKKTIDSSRYYRDYQDENIDYNIITEKDYLDTDLETKKEEVLISNEPNTTLEQKNESGIYIGSKNEKINTTNTTTSQNKNDFFQETSLEEEILFDEESETTTLQELDQPKGNLNNLNNLSVQPNEESSATIKNETIRNSSSSLTNENASGNNDSSTKNEGNPKKGSWSISLRGGVPAIIGDVNSKAGYGAALSIQKAIGHVFSLRFEALALETFGLSPKNIGNVYPNYKTRFSDYTLQGVFTLNNLNFYKKEPKVLYNVLIGGGLATRYTWINAQDNQGNLYNYDHLNSNSRKETLSALKDLLDKDYETSIPLDVEKMSIKNTNILPTLVLGFGIDFKLSEKFDLNLATRFSNHFDDNLDGLKSGKNSDWMSFTSLGLTYKFGSKNKSLLWTNPVYSKIEEIEELKKKVNDGDLLKDEDKDGIADIFDQDLNTPEKVAVDSRGIPSDMDKDGVADYLDAQPFTPIGAQVNEKGIAIDSDNDGIADILDLENNTLAGNQVDANGRTIKMIKDEGLKVAQGNSDFDLIFFDENDTKINKDFYSVLYKVSRYIDANPNATIQITGYTDVLNTEEFNLNLSEKRANAVYSMLIQMFKVSPNNLVTKFEGEQNPIIKGLPEQKDYSLNAAYYINRRVEFKILK